VHLLRCEEVLITVAAGLGTRTAITAVQVVEVADPAARCVPVTDLRLVGPKDGGFTVRRAGKITCQAARFASSPNGTWLSGSVGVRFGRRALTRKWTSGEWIRAEAVAAAILWQRGANIAGRFCNYKVLESTRGRQTRVWLNAIRCVREVKT